MDRRGLLQMAGWCVVTRPLRAAPADATVLLRTSLGEIEVEVDTILIEVVQAGKNPTPVRETFLPIPLERPKDTGLHHRDGTISMARATSDFFK